MKLRLLLMMLLLPFSVFASDSLFDLSCSNWSLEIRGAYFHPHSKALRKNYTGGWLDYQIEASWILDNHVELFASANWTLKKKKVHGCEDGGDKKRLWILPLTIGAKYYFCFNDIFSIYVGAGASYTFTQLEYHAHTFKHHASKNGFGAVFKSGLNFNWGEYTFVDIFADYFYQEINLSHSRHHLGIGHRHVDFSGYKIGVGFGVYF